MVSVLAAFDILLPIDKDGTVWHPPVNMFSRLLSCALLALAVETCPLTMFLQDL